MFKKAIVLFLAFALLTFAASAVASESGLFAEFAQNEDADARLPVLDKVAEPISVSESSDDFSIEISQAFYEGNRVLLAYRAKDCQVVQDGLDLEDGAYADITAGEEFEQEDGSIIGWKECIVPEDELADPQTFRLIYKADGSKEKAFLSFTLKQNAYDQFLKGASSTEGYQAQTYLRMGKVDLKGFVRITSPEQAASWIAWENGEESTVTDVIVGWNLYQNGKLISPDLSGETACNEEDIVFGVTFPFMEDMSGLTLVPEYGEAGEKPDEAIVLEPMS